MDELIEFTLNDGSTKVAVKKNAVTHFHSYGDDTDIHFGGGHVIVAEEYDHVFELLS